MKKLLSLYFLLALTLSFASAQITTPRFGTTKSTDNTGRALTYGYVTPTFANSYVVAAGQYYETTVKMGTLTHALTLTATVTNCHAADRLTIIFLCDTLTAGRVVTFSTGYIVSASTLTVDQNQKATISFVFDGVAWIETARAKQ